MNREWLIENANCPIKHILGFDCDFTENEQVKYWLGALSDRVLCKDLSNIHGSHDYRYENIIGKCFILGLDSSVPQFDMLIRYFLDFLDKHIEQDHGETLTFGKMYAYRDCETILACYLPFLGYAHEKSVQYVAKKRADIIYDFTKQGRYDVYRNDIRYVGVQKGWRDYILDPDMYADGNIALPSIYDLILFAGIYPTIDAETQRKIDVTIGWIFGEGYSQIHRRFYYYAPDDPRYKAKAIDGKVHLHTFDGGDEHIQSLLFKCFIFSHFDIARESQWYNSAINYLDNYRTADGRYVFPREMTAEKRDISVTSGGHMNVGENKRSRGYAEIISTYWMERILSNGKNCKL